MAKAVKVKKKPTVAQMRKQFESATKLHQILKIALHDLRAAEKSKKYVIDMYEWYAPAEGGKCQVCLAGSVMAGRYKSVCDKKLKEYPHGISPEVLRDYDEATAKLDALNALRCGDVGDAAHLLHGETEYCGYRYDISKCPYAKYHKLDRQVMPYDDNRESWWEDMKELLADLKEDDL